MPRGNFASPCEHVWASCEVRWPTTTTAGQPVITRLDGYLSIQKGICREQQRLIRAGQKYRL